MLTQDEQNLIVFSAVLNKIADNVLITDSQGIIEYVNPAFEATTGFSAIEAVGQTPRILRSGQQDTNYYKSLWETILSGKVFRSIIINKKKNGEIYYADQTVTPVLNDVGEIRYFISIWKDITERIVAEEKLRQLSEQIVLEKNKLEQVLGIEAVLHSISDLHKLIDFVINKTCEILEAQKCSIMFVDEESGELCIRGYRGVEESKIEEKTLRIGDQIEDLIELHRTDFEVDSDSVKSSGSLKIDGSIYRNDTFISVPIFMGEHLLGIINVYGKKGTFESFNDLDLRILLMIVRQVKVAIENARLYRNLKYLAVTDSMTGIYNYRYLIQTLDYEILRLKRYQRGLSFLMIDIDEFKTFNDIYGHQEGDRILKEIAKTIKSCVREMDSVCRYGGDEFSVILPETDLEQARIVAMKIKSSILEIHAKALVTISIGVAQCTIYDSRHDLVRRADKALYSAKHMGRNQISQ